MTKLYRCLHKGCSEKDLENCEHYKPHIHEETCDLICGFKKDSQCVELNETEIKKYHWKQIFNKVKV